MEFLRRKVEALKKILAEFSLANLKRYGAKFLINRWVWPFIISAGPVISSICLEWDRIRIWILNNFPFIKGFVNPATGIMTALFWVPLWAKIKESLESKYGDHLSERNIAYLVEALDDPVKDKKDRFWKKFKKLKKNAPKKGTIFQEITKPEEQITTIAKSIYAVFRKLTTGKLHVVVFEYKGGNLKYLTYYPSDAPNSKPEELNKSNSAVRTAIEQKELLIIPDICSEIGKKFVVTPSSSRKSGSILCYPFRELNMEENNWLVVSVYSDQANDFLNYKEIKNAYIFS